MGLFGELPEQQAPAGPEGRGRPRLREPERDQVALRAVDVDSLIGAEHPARVIWSYVERLDLSELEDRIGSREDGPGHPAISPRLLLALWLYATSQGVGSARLLERLCESDDGYRWLVGGVSVNYHTLADFRVGHPEFMGRLMTAHVAALAAAGVVDLGTLAQDGLRVRAAAGASSYRRRDTVERHLAAARAVVEQLAAEVDGDAAASERRRQAARRRAARERAARLEAALGKLAEIEACRAEAVRTHKKENQRPKQEPRASTTDPEARVMKMADGGFRPAWNLQIASAPEHQIVVAITPHDGGADGGLIQPMLERVEARLGCRPARHLADGGFTKNDDTEWAHERGTAVYSPPIRNRHGTDPYRPRRSDGPGVADWRRRMNSDHGQAIYRRRSLAECIHARFWQWNLRFTVRGARKVSAVASLFALANNLLQAHRLATAAA